jgi:hypothetical protein
LFTICFGLETSSIIFRFSITTHALARDNENYQKIITSALNSCQQECKKTLFESDIEKSVHELMILIIQELHFQLSNFKIERFNT